MMLVSACKPAATWTPLATITPLPTTTDTPVPPTVTLIPEVHNSIFTLQDGSKVILKPDARVKILTQPGNPAGSLEVTLQIDHGEVMVIPNPDSGNWFTVLSSKLYVARSQGCAMVVNFDEMADAFEMKCIGGTCEAGSDLDHITQVPGNKAWLFQRGNYLKLNDIDYVQLAKDYSDFIPVCVADAQQEPPIPVTGGETPSPEVDFAATATAACSAFHSKFPATPCP